MAAIRLLAAIPNDKTAVRIPLSRVDELPAFSIPVSGR